MDFTDCAKIRIPYQFVCCILCGFSVSVSIFLLYDFNGRWATVSQPRYILDVGSNRCCSIRNISMHTSITQSSMHTDILFHVTSRDKAGCGTEKSIRAHLIPDRSQEQSHDLEVLRFWCKYFVTHLGTDHHTHDVYLRNLWRWSEFHEIMLHGLRTSVCHIISTVVMRLEANNLCTMDACDHHIARQSDTNLHIPIWKFWIMGTLFGHR